MSEHSFTIDAIPGYLATLFIAPGPDGLLLLDGGCRGDMRRLQRHLHTTGRGLRDIRLIMVTHMHPDHAGGAPHLRRCCRIPLAAHRDIDRWYRGGAGWLQHKVDMLLAQYAANRNGQSFEFVWYDRFIRPDHPLADGDRLPGFPDWQALWVPGHTLYDMVLWHKASGTLYAADLVIHRNGRFLLPFPVPFPEKMAGSLRRLATLPVQRLLLAHGGTLSPDDPAAVFNELADQCGLPPVDQFRKLAPLCRLAPDIRHPGNGDKPTT